MDNPLHPVPKNGSPKAGPQNAGKRKILFWLLGFIIVFYLLNPFSQGKPAYTPTYNTFVQQLNNNKVKSMSVTPASDSLSVTLKDKRQYTIGYPGDAAIAQITATAEKKGVPLSSNPAKGTSIFLTLLISFLPIAIIIGLFIYIGSKGAAGGMLGLGKSPAKKYEALGPKVTFNDIAGVDEALSEVKEIEEFLKTPERFHKLGARVPRGV